MIDYPTTLLAATTCAMSVLVGMLASRPWKNERLAGLPALGLAVGLLGGMVVLFGMPSEWFPVKTRWHWLYWAPVPLIVAGAVEAIVGPRKALTWIVALLAIIASIGLGAVGRVHARGWQGMEIPLWISASAAVAIGTALASHYVSQKIGARSVGIAWAVTAVAMAGAGAFLSKFQSLGTIISLLAPGVGMVAVLLFCFPKFSPGIALWATLAALATVLISAASEPWYGSMHPVQAVLLALAPLGAVAGLMADRSRWWAPPLVVALATIAIACWPIGATISEYQAYDEEGMLPW